VSSFESTPPRFFRPADVAGIRRNQNRIQVQRLLVIIRGMVLTAILAAVAVWIYRHTQSDVRFAVKTIEVGGAVHTSNAEIDRITRDYVGLNLFKIDIGRVQRDLRTLPWVSRVDIEKKLPDTLRIRIAERTPVALARDGARFSYVDEHGVAFAPLAIHVGDPDLPVISGGDLARCVRLLRDLRTSDPQVYSRISEVRSIAPDAFALFDRDLGTLVYANAGDLSAKWRSLYSIADAERFRRGAIQYADLRFADRIVIKPMEPVTTEAVRVEHTTTAQITN
jgi:cell division protein FtsQ